jgi:hypothetical protein
MWRAEAAINASKTGSKSLSPEQVNDIFQSTGWFPGTDNRWRYEIPDNLTIQGTMPNAPAAFAAANARGETQLNPFLEGMLRHMGRSLSDEARAKLNAKLQANTPIKRQGTVEQFIDHPELFAAYPEAAQIPLKVTGKLDAAQEGVRTPGVPGSIEAGGSTPTDITSVLLHELQHYVQEQEGFAGGGNPEATAQGLAELVPNAGEQLNYPHPYDIYRALKGEVEARQVASRYELGYDIGAPPNTGELAPIFDKGPLGMDIPSKHQVDFMWLVNPENVPEVQGLPTDAWGKAVANGTLHLQAEDAVKGRLLALKDFLQGGPLPQIAAAKK